MHKLVMAVVVPAVFGGLPVEVAAADGGPHHHARHYVGAGAAYVDRDPAVRGRYVMNGHFDWRRRGEKLPWYARGYSDNCVAWSRDAYHYACDPNSRY